MVFSSFLFLFGFLPVVLCTYYLLPASTRNIFLLLVSYLFYGWGAPAIVPVLLISSIIDYAVSTQLTQQNLLRRFWLSIGVMGNVLLLGYFKYANFFVAEFNSLLRFYGFQPFSWAAVALPIGISFFTFQKISYLIDVYRGVADCSRNVLNYLLYVVFFPQLIAGPIIRYHDIEAQLRDREHSLEKFSRGAVRFLIGLGKKVLLADVLGAVTDTVFALNTSQLGSQSAWLGIICYSFQIYFDFSGYSDMAIGLGGMFGFSIPENFNRPYSAKNFTEFWRRWHISLSQWMKEYLYLPLGGNRKGALRTYLNLWTVFLLSGLWHGASWNFVVWGAFHGFFLASDKMFWLRISQRLPTLFKVCLTYLLVLFGWVFFRAETLHEALQFFSVMFSFSEATDPPFMGSIIHARAWVALWCAAVLSFIPWSEGKLFVAPEYIGPRTTGLAWSWALLLLLAATCALASAGHTPFLYFKF